MFRGTLFHPPQWGLQHHIDPLLPSVLCLAKFAFPAPSTCASEFPVPDSNISYSAGF